MLSTATRGVDIDLLADYIGGAPFPDNRQWGGVGMAVVYRGPHVVVTDDFFEVLGPGRARYAVKDLDLVNVFQEMRGPARWHLIAMYRGEPKTLFSSTKEREFAKVCRGLRRAFKRHHDKMAA